MREILKGLLTAGTVNIYTHRGPDGDSLSSCVGLQRMLTHLDASIDAQVIVLDPLDGKLATCSVARDVRTTDRAADLYVYPDTSRVQSVTALHTPSICIDHHTQRQPFSDVEYVRVWPSCSGMLYRAFRALGYDAPPSVAEALLVGAVDDTGCGKYGSLQNRARALRDIRELDDICGQYTPSFVNSFFGLTLEQQRWALELSERANIRDGVCTVHVPPEQLVGKTNASIRRTLQELTNTLSASYYLWCRAMQPDPTGPLTQQHLYSLRGEGDVLTFALRYGGNGHVQAAGFVTKEEPSTVFAAFHEYVRTIPRIHR